MNLPASTNFTPIFTPPTEKEWLQAKREALLLAHGDIVQTIPDPTGDMFILGDGAVLIEIGNAGEGFTFFNYDADVTGISESFHVGALEDDCSIDHVITVHNDKTNREDILTEEQLPIECSKRP